ncbi:LLM class flavin-dependent oxidoreductase [Azotobacter vinelandii]|uniref:LLM class flavin-dependent oxidoreductase n=1 Tax=Azotobacter TaxID=352 RepID=UPI00003895EC|nr:LLM class flavin-dependent oxidoreductase [Azotobacter vinelandii]GLK58378.1 monooxygenase [Azotobacter vinelandii]SFX73998.1 FMN-dependent oxidoreductase, nitrilotriacetate monooxygenase family [Azotobacter vinelandii]
MSRHLHLNLFVHGRGHHEASWRHPLGTRQRLTDLDYYKHLASVAEKGLLDSLFLADALSMDGSIRHVATGGLEPITLVAALAGATSNIGLVATASTTYTEPFNLARQFASLDHISNGRIGWNIVTSWTQGAEANFGFEQQPPHAERYARAFEFLEVVTGLWNSWSDNAIVDDPASGLFLEPSLIRAIDHQGAHFRVKGPLNVPRSPQGYPVLFQAGSSAGGQRFAARYAEAVFTAQPDLASAQAFYRSLKEQTVAAGRRKEDIAILPGISPVIAASDREADALWRELNELTAVETGLARLSNRFGGHDFSHLPLDRPLSVDDFPDPHGVQAAQSRAVVITDLVRQQRPTLRELLHRLAGARGHFTLAGSPERIADTIQTWFEEGAADGFNLMPPILPALLETFVEEVVPLLQKRGLFRTHYEGTTLRDRYGLKRPSNPYF